MIEKDKNQQAIVPEFTNSFDRVVRILQTKSIAFTVHRHAELDPAIRSPQAFAAALGYELSRVTKTLFVRSANKNQKAMVVAPINHKVDMRKIASHLGCSRVEIAPSAELQEQLGFVYGGVSPIISVPMQILMEESLFTVPSILIGSGQKAVEIELSAESLKVLTGAHVFSFSHPTTLRVVSE